MVRSEDRLHRSFSDTQVSMHDGQQCDAKPAIEMTILSSRSGHFQVLTSGSFSAPHRANASPATTKESPAPWAAFPNVFRAHAPLTARSTVVTRLGIPRQARGA